MGIKMRPKDKELLRFIQDFTANAGWAPTYNEMLEGVSQKSKKGIFDSLDRLVASKNISRAEGKSRAIKVLMMVESGD
tara:strand:- start:451 stop:684 length:234 start_codon:yes stop_codon:yes gene_type:complete